jgi:hypothetical protein
MTTREAGLLAPWQAACARHLGRAPRLIAAPDGPRLDFPSDGTALHREVTVDIRVFPHARVRDHLRRLGYGWGDDGVIATTPSPLDLRPRLCAAGLTDAGYTPELHRLGRLALSLRTWLARQIAGFVPVVVATPACYARAAALAPVLPRRAHARLRYHLHGVQHDLTRHALMLHLVPAVAVRDLGRRVRLALAAARGLFTPEPLTRFYENDLTGYCQAIWRDLPDPAAFAPTFLRPHNLDQLHAALARRVAESQRPLWRRLRDPCAEPPAYANLDRP